MKTKTYEDKLKVLFPPKIAKIIAEANQEKMDKEIEDRWMVEDIKDSIIKETK